MSFRYCSLPTVPREEGGGGPIHSQIYWIPGQRMIIANFPLSPLFPAHTAVRPLSLLPPAHTRTWGVAYTGTEWSCLQERHPPFRRIANIFPLSPLFATLTGKCRREGLSCRVTMSKSTRSPTILYKCPRMRDIPNLGRRADIFPQASTNNLHPLTAPPLLSPFRPRC